MEVSVRHADHRFYNAGMHSSNALERVADVSESYDSRVISKSGCPWLPPCFCRTVESFENPSSIFDMLCGVLSATSMKGTRESRCLTSIVFEK